MCCSWKKAKNVSHTDFCAREYLAKLIELSNGWLADFPLFDCCKLTSLQENGVKDAVEKGYLDSAELNFHTLGDKATEKNIYESYAITVTYAEGTDEIRVGARISSGGMCAPAMNVQYAQAQLDNLIDSVYTMMKYNDRRPRSAPRPGMAHYNSG